MQFTEKDLMLFLKTGYNPFINPNETAATLFDRMGREPDEIVGDKKGGFYYYGHLRFGYNEDQMIDHFGVDMRQLKKPFLVHLKEVNQDVRINKKTGLHRFLYLLNWSTIEWSMKGGKIGNRGLAVHTKGDVYATFYDDSGELALIFRSWEPFVYGKEEE